MSTDGSAPLRYTTAASVGLEHARATWALAAREHLTEVAGRYHAVTTYAELADFVQRRSLIRTDQQPRHWIGDVLRRVGEECARRGEPLLSALCVDAKGHVGAGYSVAVEAVTGRPPADADDHAAHERLACHRHFGADLPPGGGVPVRVDQPRARRAPAAGRAPRAATARATAAPDKPVVTCPEHFTVLPASGVCDLCD